MSADTNAYKEPRCRLTVSDRFRDRISVNAHHVSTAVDLHTTKASSN